MLQQHFGLAVLYVWQSIKVRPISKHLPSSNQMWLAGKSIIYFDDFTS
jgi:hypothetical protein